MLKRVLLGVVVVFAIAVIGVVALLLPAHLDIRRGQPPLPSVPTVRAAVASVAETPVRLGWINTSAQTMPRTTVLGRGDPHPERPYRLSHSVFVVEWADGRILLVDAGMTREQAAAFGALVEWVGAEPITVTTTAAELLGERARSVGAIVFTHLHVDHVDGARELCSPGEGARVSAFVNQAQMRRTNYTTGDALETLRQLECLQLVELGEVGPLTVDGFPGVFLIPVGGHTPGSQLVVVALRDGVGRRAVVITGDVVNNVDGINFDVGKPGIYSTLIVPEDDSRLSEVRRYLLELRDRAGFELLVSHDEFALASSAVAPYGASMVADAGR